MLGFGVGISHCGIRGGVSDAPDFAASAAKALLAGETQGLAFSFADDQSAYILDTGTPANNYDSTGIVSSGALVGPGGKLTYTSASNKICRQASGFFTYGAHNLCLQSEDLTAAGWASNSATRSADKFLEVAATAEHYAYRTMTSMVSGADYVLSVEVSGIGRDWCALSINDPAASITWFNLAGSGSIGTDNNSGSTIELLSDGYYKVSIRITAGATTVYPVIYSALANGSTSFAGDAAKGLFVRKAHVYRYPANTDYIRTTSAAVYSLPYSYAVDGSCEGLLVEEQRTNLIQSNYGSALNTAYWTYGNATYAAATGIDGVSGSAATVQVTASGGSIRASEVTLTAAAYTFSVYAKQGTTEFITLRGSFFTTNFQIGFNISTGVADTGGVITNCGNGWYRCSVTWTPGGADVAGFLYMYPANTLSGIASDIGDNVTIFSPQVELGSFPTSPILTYGATATRAADQKAQLTSTFPLSATAGSLYAYVVPYAGSDLAGIVSLNDGSGDEEIVIYKDASANIVAQVEDGGVGQLAPIDSTVNASSNTAFKVALAWAANDFALAADGTAAQTDAGGTLPTVTTLELGVDQANNYFNGIIKAISYVPRRKTDAELQAETA